MSKHLRSTASVFLGLVISCFAYAEDQRWEGTDGAVVDLQGMDTQLGGYTRTQYTRGKEHFRLYDWQSGIDTVTYTIDTDMSPDKRFLIVERTEVGTVEDGAGKTSLSDDSSCDMIEMSTGCVRLSGWKEQCDGHWVGNKWTIAEGGELDGKTPPPTEIIKSLASITDRNARAVELQSQLFMGVNSYASCYPPEHSVAEFNDIGFYLAQGGMHQAALEVYKKLLVVAPERVPLKLNMADSLWALGQQADAKAMYQAYKNLIVGKGAASKVPGRVEARLK